ncbi:expansin-like B1 [Beta vulgaris subsp. vulgaris]|uniref:expansin-like B1 n=1 Tax=Beta vulgaris subsp. vulgaris TaxID=3555 RepID=UPI0020371947|nr:expansin-like B1 [Beta vulgaris subsp. vulgaris]
MGSILKYALFLVLVLLPALICCLEEPIFHSKATYYYATDGLGTPKGGCAYGEYGRTINDGDVALVTSSKLYKGGASCGACYKVRCKEAECAAEGVVVVVTDYGVSDGDTDLILSTHAFNKMAMPKYEKELRDYGKVNIEYQRVACQYPGKTLTIKVLDHSHFHSYLALQFLYLAGNADITAVELFEEDTLEWKRCRRAYGTVWDIANPPKGPLTVRFFLDGSVNVRARWVLVPKVIPTFWQAGVTYDTSIQFH